MRAQSNVAPVIIKKKIVKGDGGHHGGAWKVAYADFVTAMMAFFLLMWLLNATTEQQRKGLADYFSPTIPISRVSGGGDGAFGGDSVFSEDVLPQNGTGASSRLSTEGRKARGEIGVADEGGDAANSELAEEYRAVENVLMGRSGESMISPETRQHILTRVTDEGLVIEVFDLENAILFEPESDNPTRLLRDLADLIGSVGNLVDNGLSVEGHTRAEAVVRIANPVWDLSTRRANRMRLLLQDAGIADDRMRRITGHADRAPVVDNPMAARNNRLEVILLRSDI